MQIITISPRGFGANTYIIPLDNQKAIVIDPAQPRIADELKNRGLTAAYVLLTHCHFDHVYGVPALQDQGAKVFCSDKEKPLIGTNADVFDLFRAPRVPYTVDETFTDNEEKILGGISIKALLTPGHTAGSCCYLFTAKDGGRYLFTGDTLFSDSIGRTDFPTGDIGQMRASLKRLASLDDMPVYPGHNEPTTIDNERKYNPFMLDA
ncbi:MAG: MBL fold metallo-hydrolase [Clostridiales bacterium]|nr:MBL fold metallo-hydrolase [Clostridiales bacterium]